MYSDTWTKPRPGVIFSTKIPTRTGQGSEVFTLTEVFINLTEVFLTLTEGFPCFFLSCNANARVKLVKTGHGPHTSTLVVICVVRLLLVLFYVLFVCKFVLSPGDNPIAVNKYIIHHIRIISNFPHYMGNISSERLWTTTHSYILHKARSNQSKRRGWSLIYYFTNLGQNSTL